MSSQRQPFMMPRVSPDGSRIAVAGTAGSGADIWVYDIANAALTRVTQEQSVSRPEWDASGKRVAFRPTQWQEGVFVSQPWDRGGVRDTIRGTESAFAMSWGAAGRYVAVQRRVNLNDDVWIVPRGAPTTSFPVDTTKAAEFLPRLSPNERWVAYVSDESGRTQIYARPVPGPGPRVAISVQDGEQPAWAHDSKTVYYIDGTVLMAARLSDSPALTVTRRDTMFAVGANLERFNLDPAARMLMYDVFPDGGFVFLGTGSAASANRVNAIALVDWSGRVRHAQ
jgi:Tol biopolymer transport system component